MKSINFIERIFLSHEILKISNQIIISNLYSLLHDIVENVESNNYIEPIFYYRMKLLKLSNHIFLYPIGFITCYRIFLPMGSHRPVT